ncbi:protein BPS1, chloroplastic-like [Amaranthus tricolor]|uniref:protein BPS1, chloroplastic-like n=1 Tax=Amaranthus tricolor TaxID=29722 RepID=UPI002589F731|nr:protein BPS1, chloroplastic-like [Amaranthus tricolor]
MSRPQEPHRPFFPHGNPFRMILPKGSYLSPKLQALLNNFEETLAGRLRKLVPKCKDDVFSVSWMLLAVQLLSETHNDIKSLITELGLPVVDWDDKWIDVYLDNSVKLLDICIALSSELSRLSQGQLLLHCVLRNLEQSGSSKAKSSIDSWRQHIGSKNPRIDNCFAIIDKLTESLELPKVKNSAKGKTLMRAMYGVRVQTLFVCSAFMSAFTGSDKKLIDLHVTGTHLWGEAFNDLQRCVFGEIRNLVLSDRNVLVKELEAVSTSVSEVYSVFQEGVEPTKSESVQKSVVELRRNMDELSSGLDLLAKEVDGFFHIVLSGRDALLGNLRVSGSVFDPPKKHKMEEQLVR